MNYHYKIDLINIGKNKVSKRPLLPLSPHKGKPQCVVSCRETKGERR